MIHCHSRLPCYQKVEKVEIEDECGDSLYLRQATRCSGELSEMNVNIERTQIRRSNEQKYYLSNASQSESAESLMR